MTVYEMRTYTLHVGKMTEAVKLYTEHGYPALQKGGQDKKLIGYFQADTGTINQLVHLWKFDDERLLSETEEEHTVRYFFPLELDLFLESAGFASVRLGAFPEFDRDPDESTWNALCVARAV